MNHDWFRSLKDGKPFLLMESTPSLTNWQPISKLKKPGMHALSSLQAVAHGSDSVQYFQWRKSRGSSEKFHGAVVDHVGHEHTRVFQEVKNLGEDLSKLDEVVGTTVAAEVAIVFDTENRWAVKDAQGPRNNGVHYERTVVEHYQAFWEQGIAVDVIDSEKDLSKYKLVVAPMLYMIRPGVGEAIEKFVQNGGTFVTTYWSGIVNENDLCFLDGFPGPLRKTLGIWSEEIDGLYDGEVNPIKTIGNNKLGIQGEYEARELCDLIHLEGAEALANYGADFYAGRPALTVNNFGGEGKAYYIASRNDHAFQQAFYQQLADKLELKRAIAGPLPKDMSAQIRTDGENEFLFLMNFSNETKKINLHNQLYQDILNGDEVNTSISLDGFSVKVLRK